MAGHEAQTTGREVGLEPPVGPEHSLTRENSDWSTWYAALRRYAASRGRSAADAEAWREGYDAGRSPAAEWADAWGEA